MIIAASCQVKKLELITIKTNKKHEKTKTSIRGCRPAIG